MTTNRRTFISILIGAATTPVKALLGSDPTLPIHSATGTLMTLDGEPLTSIRQLEGMIPLGSPVHIPDLIAKATNITGPNVHMDIIDVTCMDAGHVDDCPLGIAAMQFYSRDLECECEHKESRHDDEGVCQDRECWCAVFYVEDPPRFTPTPEQTAACQCSRTSNFRSFVPMQPEIGDVEFEIQHVTYKARHQEGDTFIVTHVTPRLTPGSAV